MKIFGRKTETWQNVHSEFESAESGAWFTSGDERMYLYSREWLTLFGMRLWPVGPVVVDDLGLYDIQDDLAGDDEFYDDDPDSVYDDDYFYEYENLYDDEIEIEDED